MPKDIKQLIAGSQQFQQRYFTGNHSAYQRLVRDGQQPEILIVACSDSRVDPALVLNCEPGDLFVVRNVANLVPPYEIGNGYHGTSAALEFGVCELAVKHIIIFGHSQCGGIRALLTQPQTAPATTFTAKWMELAQPAYQFTMAQHPRGSIDEQCGICAQQALIYSLHNLQTFPWIAAQVHAEKLILHAWYFDLLTGITSGFDYAEQAFLALK